MIFNGRNDRKSGEDAAIKDVGRVANPTYFLIPGKFVEISTRDIPS